MNQHQHETKAPKTLGEKLFLGLWVLMSAWILLLLPVGFALMGAGVPSDLAWGTCQVTDATAQETDDVEHPWRIVLETSDCSTLIYTDGLTDDNVHRLTATFEPAPYEVYVHESAIDPNGDVRYAKELVIHSYRLAP